MKNRKTTMLTALLTTSLLSVAGIAQGDIYLGQENYSTWNLYGNAISYSFTNGGYLYKGINLTTAGTGDSAGAAFAPAPPGT